MGVYASLGVAQAIGFFLLGAVLSFMTYFASKGLHKASSNLIKVNNSNKPQAALKRILHSPMSFFDTNPLGRIMNRFSKGEGNEMFASRISNMRATDIDTIGL